MKKKILLAALLTAAIGSSAHADDRPIDIGQLPGKAQQFIRQHFPQHTVSYAKTERDFLETTYEVIFTDGSKTEFRKNGDWKEVDCRYASLPANLVPAQIGRYVCERHPDTRIVQIEQSKREIEIRLSNGLELTFDRKFNLIDIDD